MSIEKNENIKEVEQNPKISVIVPVYKVERYLPRCIESILRQTYTNFELLLIDDGSPDKSGEICDKYAEKDSRIRVFHKENGGVSSARNLGIEEAKGEWITFVDSDDWLTDNALEILKSSADCESADLIMGSITQRGLKSLPKILKTQNFVVEHLRPEVLFDIYISGGFYGPFAKFFRTNIIRKNNILFLLGVKCGEDTLFVREYLKYCKKINRVSSIVYYYNLLNQYSATKQFYNEIKDWGVLRVKSLESLLNCWGCEENIKQKIVAEHAFSCVCECADMYIKTLKRFEWVDYIKMFIELMSSYLVLSESWVLKQDDLSSVRKIVKNKDVFAMYKIYKKGWERKKIKCFLKKIGLKIVAPYIEKKRDGLISYKKVLKG